MAVKSFLNEIVRFLKKGNYSKKFRKKFDKKIRTLFLECYSETEENLDVFHYLKYGKAPNPCGPLIGFKVKEQDILIMDILNTMECMENIPNEVKNSFPNLTYAQWSAASRMATTLLIELDGEIKKK
jgi:hypothetical protein